MVVALTGGLSLLPAYTDTYNAGVVDFCEILVSHVSFGSDFRKGDGSYGGGSFCGKKIVLNDRSPEAILAVIISCGILVYGGISLFVVVFAIYPIAVSLFREADLPRRLIPGCIACGAFTFSMTAFPGNPQLNNHHSHKYFGTNAMSGPVMGIAGGSSCLWEVICGCLTAQRK